MDMFVTFLCVAWYITICYGIEDKPMFRAPEKSIDITEKEELEHYKRVDDFKHPRWTVGNLREYTIEADRKHLPFIMLDYMADARYKKKQLEGLRLTHRKTIAYELGYAFGLIREKYREMAEIYRMMIVTEKKKNIPSIQPYTEVDFVNRLEEISALEFDINKLIDIMEQIPIKNLKFVPAGVGRRNFLGQFRRYEEKYKSDMRRQFHMKQLGKPENASTTAKRFDKKWPVEETWDMYNDKILNN